MAGDWMKVEKVTPDKPEVFAIADALGIDPDAAFGKCFRVWSWFDGHCENGCAPSATKNHMDRQVGIPGFADVMISAGWLLEKNGMIRMPNFDRHCSKSAKRRALAQRTMAKLRCANGATKTPPEKRREEKRIPPPPTPASVCFESAPDPEPLSSEWQAVAKAMAKGGVGSPQMACESARGRGCSTFEAMRVVEEFNAHPGAWGPGLLFKIIEQLTPEKKVSWPEKSPEYLRMQEQAKRKEQVKKQVAKRAVKASITDEDLEKRSAVFKSGLSALLPVPKAPPLLSEVHDE